MRNKNQSCDCVQGFVVGKILSELALDTAPSRNLSILQ